MGLASFGLNGEILVRKHWTCERDEVRNACGQETFRVGGVVDAVGGDDRDGRRLLDLPDCIGPGGAGDDGGDGRHCRFMPADPGVQHRRAGLLDHGCQLPGLVSGHASGHQVKRRDPVDDEEILR